ncbi:hypothetical protein ABE208_16130 [Bacillus inaquosorum]|uniref:hypothetical protein n=1 Tax=Bacillus inaquosorum TaxID=483913 RepID=UPI00227FC213|nr:hypothetical protein [Bacillus inaquosorum]MCY9084325.1 hypothetical protein [Bacillus inaquosorum]
MIRATEKQLRLIGRMEQYISARFTGNTIREASEFITNHMDEYQEEKRRERNVLRIKCFI